ncbi:MAG: Uma2 family endonuclease [Bacteroidota bacterium]
MTTTTHSLDQVIVPVTTVNGNASLDKEIFGQMLKGRDYLLIGSQLFFEREEQYFITRIDHDSQTYTNEDYQLLPFNAPYQLINGQLVFMASPLDKHQQILGDLNFLVASFVRKYKIGQVRFAPLDVHFDEENIFQPDLLFISNERINIIQRFIHGAPDLIVEVLSSNKKHDLEDKKDIYGKYNVLEYWAIDYDKETLAQYINEERELKLERMYQAEEEVQSRVLEGFSFVLREIFE